MAGQIYRDTILQQRVHMFRSAMGAYLVVMDDNARPYRASIGDECFEG